MANLDSIEQLIDDKIYGKKVMMFSKTHCPFCTKAKKIFLELIRQGVLCEEDFEVMEIENDPNMAAIQKKLKQKTGASSVPRVFINQECVGGGEEVVALHSNNQLLPLLGETNLFQIITGSA